MTADWFEALGEPIPEENVDVAVEQCREMGLDDPDLRLWVERIAKHIEDDWPEGAITKARQRLDVTGVFRLLAYLCVGHDEVDSE